MDNFSTQMAVLDAFQNPELSDIETAQEEYKYEVIIVHGKPIRCTNTSLYLFSVTNKFRFAMLWFQEWKWFDRFILFLIALNSLFLAL